MPKPLGVQTGFPPGGAEREKLVQRVQVADEMGVDSVWVPEAWGRDAFTFLTELALKTRRIKLATGIVNVYGRSPAVLAMTAAHIDEISGGRFILGLGSSGQLVVEHWHGVSFALPLTRLREYIEIIRMILRGERLIYHGKLFTLDRGFRFQDFTPLRDRIPIYVAALTEKSIRQTGELADGWMPIYWPLERFPDGIALLREGATKAGRPPSEVTVAPAISVFVVDSQDRSEVALRARRPIAFYVGRMGVFYYQMLARNGFSAEVAAIREAWERRDPEGAARAVSDRMLESTTVVGSLEECAVQLEERRQAGVGLPVVSLPESEPREVERFLAALIS